MSLRTDSAGGFSDITTPGDALCIMRMVCVEFLGGEDGYDDTSADSHSGRCQETGTWRTLMGMTATAVRVVDPPLGVCRPGSRTNVLKSGHWRDSRRREEMLFRSVLPGRGRVYAAQDAGARWIAANSSLLRVELLRRVLIQRRGLVPGRDFAVKGVPRTVWDAERLSLRDPSHFEHWLVERVGAFPSKKTLEGVHGHVYYSTDDGCRGMAIRVRRRGLRPRDVRELDAVIKAHDEVELGGILSLEEPSRRTRQLVDNSPLLRLKGKERRHVYSSIQLLTVKDVVERGWTFDVPS